MEKRRRDLKIYECNEMGGIGDRKSNIHLKQEKIINKALNNTESFR